MPKHKYTTDWLRQVHITADDTLAEKRWDTAEVVVKTLSRDRITGLLHLFLFQPKDGTFCTTFTDELIAIDANFPVSGNTQELRLMAGLVMVAAFSNPSKQADALALGLQSANFPRERSLPIQPAVLTEAYRYIQEQANRIRPNNFSPDAGGITRNLLARTKALTDAETAGEEAKQVAALANYRKAVPDTIESSHRHLAGRIEQLSEETAMLWWVLGEYSDYLKQPVRELSDHTYALVAAWEASQRTLLLPPPVSMAPLIARMIHAAKKTRKAAQIGDYLLASPLEWRAAFAKMFNVAGCADLACLSTLIAKSVEFSDPGLAVQSMLQQSTRFPAELALNASAVAEQLYTEIIFLRALKAAESQ